MAVSPPCDAEGLARATSRSPSYHAGRAIRDRLDPRAWARTLVSISRGVADLAVPLGCGRARWGAGWCIRADARLPPPRPSPGAGHARLPIPQHTTEGNR